MKKKADHIVYWLLTASALSQPGTAQAQDDAAALEAKWSRQNAICLEGQDENEGPVTARMAAGCRARNEIVRRLRAVGRCFGEKASQGHYAMRWHDCTPDSLTWTASPWSLNLRGTSGE